MFSFNFFSLSSGGAGLTNYAVRVSVTVSVGIKMDNSHDTLDTVLSS